MYALGSRSTPGWPASTQGSGHGQMAGNTRDMAIRNWVSIKVPRSRILEREGVLGQGGSMYGLLLESARHYVVNLHGEEAWSAIVHHSGTPDLVFTTHGRYCDSTILKLAAACAKVIKDRSENEYMCFLGQCFVEYCAHVGYDKIMRISGRYYRDFLHGIDNLHETIRFSYPKMVNPSFYVEQEDRNGCVLHYRSQRVGFTHYVIGQLTQFATKNYNVRVDIDVLSEEVHAKGCHVTYRLNFDNIAFNQRRQSQVARSLEDFPPINLSTFFKVFPFALVFDRDLRVVSTGQSLKVLCRSQQPVGLRVTDCFTLRRPLMDFTWENVVCHQRVMFELEIVQAYCQSRVFPREEGKEEGTTSGRSRMETSIILLKGQMRYIRDLNGMAFLCTPLIGNLEDMETHGLKLNDLSMYDSSRDMVLTGWQHASMLEYTIEKQVQKSQLIADNIRQLREWEKCSEQILYAMIPRATAILLRNGEDPVNTCKMFDSVTIMFSYLVGFTDLCASLPALQCIKTINAFFCMFDNIVDEYGIFKVETLGDAVYMAAGGVPDPTTDHAHKVSAVSLKLRDRVKHFRTPEDPDRRYNIRIGLHTGSVVAGVVGKRTPQYCLFGDTVNTASRMQTYGETGQIHISESCQDQLDGSDFITVCRGTMHIKGKGVMHTYWLVGARGDTTDSNAAAPDSNKYTEYYQTDELPVMPAFLPASPNTGPNGWPLGQEFNSEGTVVKCSPQAASPAPDPGLDPRADSPSLPPQFDLDMTSSSDDDILPRYVMRRRAKSFTATRKISVDDFRRFLQRKMASKLAKGQMSPCPFASSLLDSCRQTERESAICQRRASWHASSLSDLLRTRVTLKETHGLQLNTTGNDQMTSESERQQGPRNPTPTDQGTETPAAVNSRTNVDHRPKSPNLLMPGRPGLMMRRRSEESQFKSISPLQPCPLLEVAEPPCTDEGRQISKSSDDDSNTHNHRCRRTSADSLCPGNIKESNEFCWHKQYLNGPTKGSVGAKPGMWNNGLVANSSQEDIFQMDDVVSGPMSMEKKTLANRTESRSANT